jgi:hypothetical protein
MALIGSRAGYWFGTHAVDAFTVIGRGADVPVVADRTVGCEDAPIPGIAAVVGAGVVVFAGQGQSACSAASLAACIADGANISIVAGHRVVEVLATRRWIT